MVDARIAKLDDLGVPTGSERERILIIASIAESEVGSDKYYGQVARVILNRIRSQRHGARYGHDCRLRSRHFREPAYR